MRRGRKRNVSGDLKHKEMMAEDNERKWPEFSIHIYISVCQFMSKISCLKSAHDIGLNYFSRLPV